MVTVLALGWGSIVGALVLARAPTIAANNRIRTLRRETRRADSPRGSMSWSTRRSMGSSRNPARGCSVVTRVTRDVKRRVRARRADQVVAAQVPVAIDLLGVAIGAGCPPAGAVAIVAHFAPPDIAARFASAMDSVAVGAPFSMAVRRLGRAGTELGALGRALADGAELGTPVGPVLDRLAVETRAALRRRAEARARTVPIKLLFPLVFLVLPAFGLITVVPAVVSGLRGG